MAKGELQPQELSTARGNFQTVLVNLATGQSRVLDHAEAARAVADTIRQQASSGELLVQTSSAL
jgi:hypothetical protein